MSGAEMTKESTTRISATLPANDFDCLKALAAQRGETMTMALRRAVATEVFCRRVIADGGRILIQDEKARTLREVVFR